MRSTLLLVTGLLAVSDSAGQEEERWWPLQGVPKAVVRTEREFPNPRAGFDMMVQSVAGLAAKAVNEKRADELVWVDNGNVDMEDWYGRWLAQHPNVKSGGTFGAWELVDR